MTAAVERDTRQRRAIHPTHRATCDRSCSPAHSKRSGCWKGLEIRRNFMCDCPSKGSINKMPGDGLVHRRRANSRESYADGSLARKARRSSVRTIVRLPNLRALRWPAAMAAKIFVRPRLVALHTSEIESASRDIGSKFCGIAISHVHRCPDEWQSTCGAGSTVLARGNSVEFTEGIAFRASSGTSTVALKEVCPGGRTRVVAREEPGNSVLRRFSRYSGVSTCPFEVTARLP